MVIVSWAKEKIEGEKKLKINSRQNVSS